MHAGELFVALFVELLQHLLVLCNVLFVLDGPVPCARAKDQGVSVPLIFQMNR